MIATFMWPVLKRAGSHAASVSDCAVQYVSPEWRILTLAACFASGCCLVFATYISLPPVVVTFSLLICLAVGAWLFRLHRGVLFICAVSLLTGLLYSQLSLSANETQFIERSQVVDINVAVDSVEERTKGRSRVEVTPIAGEDSQGFRGKLRLYSSTEKVGELMAGDVVQIRALISPPSGPPYPGGFDFTRSAFFKGVAADGFVLSAPVLITRPARERSIAHRIESLRNTTATLLISRMGEEKGGIAAAILLGLKKLIPEATADAFRETGLAHLMAISGLHVGLVAGTIFFLVEAVCAAIPALALRIMPKKTAAFVAWGVSGGYVIIAGAGIPTVRAYVMVSIALLAVLLGRKVLSLRSVAVAALGVLAVSPSAVTSIGFQMSFAATAALVTFFNHPAVKQWTIPQSNQALFKKFLRYGAITCLSTVVAEIAIAPFALFHFQAVSLVGLGANLIAVPVFSILVMPLALLSLAVMPFGLEAIPLELLGYALGIVIDVAKAFSALSFSTLYLPQASDTFLELSSLTLFLSILARGRVQVFSMALGSTAMMVGYQGMVVDTLIANEGRAIASRLEHRQFIEASGIRGGSFRSETWSRYWGINPASNGEKIQVNCDADACLYVLRNGQKIGRVLTLEGLRSTCARADITVLPRRWLRYCRSRGIVLTTEQIEREGPIGIIHSTRSVVSSINRGNRPWAQPEN